jgi:hypothetical protein
MKKAVAVAGTVFLAFALSAPVRAQAPSFSIGEMPKDPIAEQKARDIDAAYQAAKAKEPKGPATKPSSDPWGDVRATTADPKPKPVAKPKTQAQTQGQPKPQ